MDCDAFLNKTMYFFWINNMWQMKFSNFTGYLVEMRIQVDCLEAKSARFHTRSTSPVGMLFFHQFLLYIELQFSVNPYVVNC